MPEYARVHYFLITGKVKSDRKINGNGRIAIIN